MRAQLHVQATALERPEQAAKQVVSQLVREFPRRRALTLAIVALGPHPGLTPTPWVLDGVFAALVEAERTPINVVTVGDHETVEALLRKSGHGHSVPAAELIERPNRDRRISLRLDPHGQAMSLPRELVGSSLLVLAPLCCVVNDNPKSKSGQLRGPMSTILSSFAWAHGARPSPAKRRPSLRPRAGSQDPVSHGAQLGHELMRASFANAALVLDSSWLALVDQGPPIPSPNSSARLGSLRMRPSTPEPVRTLAELECPERVLGLAQLGRSELQAALDIDAWLNRAIGFDGPLPAQAPGFQQPPGRWPRPRLHAPSPSPHPTRLAERAIHGIRSHSQSSRLRAKPETTALPSPVPGAFAQLWAERWYGNELGARLSVGTA